MGDNKKRNELQTTICSIGELLHLPSNEVRDLGISYKSLSIPKFQRQYNWEQDKVEQLLNDIIESYSNKENFYFLGTIQMASINNDYILSIIDGQQRLTSLELLIKYLDPNSNPIEIEIENNDACKDSFYQIMKKQNIQIDNNEDNFYIKNYNFIKKYFERLDVNKIDLINFVYNNTIVSLLYSNNKYVSLSKVLKIFDTLNTRGQELNDSDIFKIEFSEHVNKNESGFNGLDNIIKKVDECYEKISVLNSKISNQKLDFDITFDMDDILLIYQHIIIASNDSPKLDEFKESREKFFEHAFDSNNEYLKFKYFKLIVKIVEQVASVSESQKGKYSSLLIKHSISLIYWTRYWKCWTIPFILLFNMYKDINIDDIDNLDIPMEIIELSLRLCYGLSKFLLVFSQNGGRVWDSVYRYYIRIIKQICDNKTNDWNYLVVNLINSFKQKTDCRNPDKDDDVENGLNVQFLEKLNSDELYYNVCWWVALFDELDNGTKCCDVEKLFFNKNKLKFDIEHIVPQSEIIKMDNERNKIYNGIGNKMLLDSDINRKIQDDMKKKYMYYCDSKLFLPKQIRECNHRDGVIYWTDEDVKKRTEKIQEIFKYRFLNQADTF